MCNHPIKIYNQSKHIARRFMQPFLLTVPCGHCCECSQKIANEWYLRSYYEYLDCLDKGGFVLCDTLSYSDQHLPHVKDFFDVPDVLNFSCFDYVDIQNFLKRLRISLNRAGYPASKKLRYFITSEYGHDHIYISDSGRVRKGTSRPHYHVLFYVYFKIDPFELSRFISSAWYFGRTDGIAYHEDEPFRFIRNIFNSAGRSIGRCANYVSKYVQKDIKFNSLVNSRLSSIYDYLSSLGLTSKDEYNFTRQFRSRICNFHRQSRGFGLYALNFLTDEQLAHRSIKVPDPSSCMDTIPLPTYFFRHLFMENVKVDGRYSYRLTDKGFRYKLSLIERSRNLLSVHFQDWYSNLISNYLTPNDVVNGVTYSKDVCYRVSYQYFKKVSHYLGGRSFQDFADYLLFYRGRVYDGELFYKDPKLISYISLFPGSGDYGSDFFDSYVTHSDLDAYGRKFITDGVHEFDIASFIGRYVHFDDLPQFKGFEYLYQLYLDSYKYSSIRDDLAYQHRQQLARDLKEMGFHPHI